MMKAGMPKQTQVNKVPITTFNVVGIDVGKYGAVSVLNVREGRVIAANILDIPLGQRSGIIDGEELTLWICENTFINYKYPTYIFIEEVHAMPKQGVCSMFSFGRTFGYLECLADEVKLLAKEHDMLVDTFFITPQSWVNGMCGKDRKEKGKHVYLDKAVELFPSMIKYFTGPKGGLKDGRVDSLLLAEFGRRILTHEVDFFLTHFQSKANRNKISPLKRNTEVKEAVANMCKAVHEIEVFLSTHPVAKDKKIRRRYACMMQALAKMRQRLGEYRKLYKSIDNICIKRRV